MSRMRSWFALAALLCGCSTQRPFDAYCDAFKDATALVESQGGGGRRNLAAAGARLLRLRSPTMRFYDWIEVIPMISPVDVAAIVDDEARRRGTTFDCPEFRSWDAWLQKEEVDEAQREVQASLDLFCKLFEANHSIELPPEARALEIAKAVHDRRGSNLSGALREEVFGKSLGEQAPALQNLARSHGATFACPSFEAWIVKPASPNGGPAAREKKR